MIAFILFCFLFFALATAILVALFDVFLPKLAADGFPSEGVLESDIDVADLFEKETRDEPEAFLQRRAGRFYETDWNSLHKEIEEVTRDAPKKELTVRRGN
jgi:hypothetical protein